MDKLKLAHDWAMKSLSTNGFKDEVERVSYAWKYADAMQAEADKRNKAEAEQKRKEIREMLNAPNTFIEREGKHFDDVESLCEVDWNQATQNTMAWFMLRGSGSWLLNDFSIVCAPSFGFAGSHIVERPHGF